MTVERKDGKLSTAWYSKPKDTGLMLSTGHVPRNCKSEISKKVQSVASITPRRFGTNSTMH